MPSFLWLVLQGLTESVLRAIADTLAAHELVRVRLGEGAGLERKQAARQLEAALDCTAVHQIG